MYAITVRLQAVAIAAVLCGHSAEAAVRDGDALLQQCTATIGAFVDYCYGYIDAVADYLFQKHAMGEFTACVATAPDDSHLRDVVVRFLRDNPALRGLGAPELIARALSEKYRCP